MSVTLGIPYGELWSRCSAGEVLSHWEALPDIERQQQFHAAAALLLKSKQLGDKESELSDYYVGNARRGLMVAPYSDRVMRGIELSDALGLLRQPHLDALDNEGLFRYWRKSGFMRKGVIPNA